MDGQRDVSKSENLSKFFDKPTMRPALALNQSVDRLYRRVERVAAAVFLATNHIAAGDPLRRQSRESALQLLERALDLRDEMRATQSTHAADFRSCARYLISLLRMLTIGGFLSSQNSTVLIEALNELGNFLSAAQNSSLSDSVSFSRQDFIDILPSDVKDIRDTPQSKSTDPVKDNSKMSYRDTKETLDVRKQNILDIIRGAKELGISDIAAALPEYSSKTIQRDLVELIRLGRVRRQGLKRWSRYSMA
jgi:predicted transcriptional regulator